MSLYTVHGDEAELQPGSYGLVLSNPLSGSTSLERVITLSLCQSGDQKRPRLLARFLDLNKN